MDLYKDLWVCNGTKDYEKNRHSNMPDKAYFRKEFGDQFKK